VPNGRLFSWAVRPRLLCPAPRAPRRRSLAEDRRGAYATSPSPMRGRSAADWPAGTARPSRRPSYRTSSGLTQRRPEKREKSESQEFSSAPCSMASAARCASLARLPAVPSGPRRCRRAQDDDRPDARRRHTAAEASGRPRRTLVPVTTAARRHGDGDSCSDGRTRAARPAKAIVSSPDSCCSSQDRAAT
jgi:hypothetical protein